ncbi:phage gp6-like head-tail connector protein [Clostridium botulinum C/D]|uniref:head-tail connector protein n=1 Tax=Clostridium botulinum TaxID=1491 RepID=UPI001E5FD46A|nr:head-tail connector protein [Clostridium botulinum]MCD3211112.1 phage gp6-like head-tail connector protein [Clostridium botulinum C/D]
MELKDIKEYLRLDPEDIDEDIAVSSFLSAAKSYIFTATGINTELYESLNNEAKELYNLAIKLLVSEWYSNRCVNAVHAAKLSFSLDAILTALETEYWRIKNESRNT